MRMTLLAAMALAVSSGAATAQATDTDADLGAAAPWITLELNRLDEKEAACGAVLVAKNARRDRIEDLNLDLVIFDQNGVVARRLAVQMGPLRAGKTVVKGFTIAGVACGAVGQLLLNDVIACQTEVAPLDECLDRVETSSRQVVPFIK